MYGQDSAVPAAIAAMGSPDGALTPVLVSQEAAVASTAATEAPNAAGVPPVAVSQPAAVQAPVTASPTPTPAPALGAPLAVQLAPAPATGTGAGLAIEPLALVVQPDPAGPVGHATVTVTNRDAAAAQEVWVSAELPDLLTLEVALTQPHIATLALGVDLAQAAGAGKQAPTAARVFVTTAAGTTTIQVTWKPLPYGSM
jgi:hypothetical protein